MVCAAVSHSLTAVSAIAAQNQPRLARCADKITVRKWARSLEFDRGPAGPVECVLAEGAWVDPAENLPAALALGQAHNEGLEPAVIRFRDRIQEPLLQDDGVVPVAPADDDLRAVGFATVRVGAGHKAVRAGEF